MTLAKKEKEKKKKKEEEKNKYLKEQIKTLNKRLRYEKEIRKKSSFSLKLQTGMVMV